MPRVLLMTILPFHRSGNQALRNFVEGLCSRDMEILLLTTQPEEATEVRPSVPEGRLRILRARSPIRPLRQLFDRLVHRKRKTERSASVSHELGTPDVWDEVPIIPQGGITDVLWWAYEQLLFLVYGTYLVIRYRPDIIVGYEVHAALAAVAVARLFRKKAVTRFQGTGLYYWLKKDSIPLGVYHYVIATRARADLVIMANDGTRGDIVCKMLGHRPENVWFAPEGIRVGSEFTENEEKGDYLIWVSRMEDWKRLDRGLILFKHIADASGGRFRLIVVGDGQRLASWRNMAHDLGCADMVEFVGGLDHLSTCKLIQGAVALMSMFDGTNLSMAVQEAVVRRVPVISINDGSTSGLLNKESAILVDWGTQLDIEGRRIAGILQNESTLRLIADRAYASYMHFGLSEEQRKEEEAKRILELLGNGVY